jgi:hypothetical protein
VIGRVWGTKSFLMVQLGSPAVTSKHFKPGALQGLGLLLRSAGFHVAVSDVGYPLQLYLAPG